MSALSLLVHGLAPTKNFSSINPNRMRCVKHHIHTNHSSISPLTRTMVVIQSDKMQGNSGRYINLYRRKMAPLCRT